MPKSKSVKHIKPGYCRVIKIDKEALFELIYETIIDRMENYFDILDSTKAISHHRYIPETGEYICLVNDHRDKLPEDIDIDKLISKLENTTTSLYSPNRFKEMSFSEIRALIKETDH